MGITLDSDSGLSNLLCISEWKAQASGILKVCNCIYWDAQKLTMRQLHISASFDLFRILQLPPGFGNQVVSFRLAMPNWWLCLASWLMCLLHGRLKRDMKILRNLESIQ